MNHPSFGACTRYVRYGVLLAATHVAAQAPPPQSAIALTPAPIALSYVSTFTTYRSLKSEPATPWRAANDAVLQIGGWRTYAREPRTALPGAEPAIAPAASGAAPASPAARANPHAHHQPMTPRKEQP